jgi:hypothetical protein
MKVQTKKHFSLIGYTIKSLESSLQNSSAVPVSREAEVGGWLEERS